MLNCEFCYNNPSLTFTRCCKSLLCNTCCQRIDKKLICTCGRPFAQGKKNYTEYPQIMSILKRFAEQKGRQCDRCDSKAEVKCDECNMIFCQLCNTEMHAAIGFAKHNRKKITQIKPNIEKMKKKEVLCLQHNQAISSGCECGAGLCSICTKQHKDTCPKGFRTKVLKQFKQEYFLNFLLKMRQLSFFKQKLCEDKLKYTDNFKTQQTFFQTSQKLIFEQFDYLTKMLQIKYSQIKSKLTQYWTHCQSIYEAKLEKITQQIKNYDVYAQLMQMFSQNLTNLDFFDRKIRKFNVNLDFVNLKSLNFDQAQSSLISIGVQQKPWQMFNPDCLASDTQQKQISKQDVRFIGNLQNTSELMIAYTHNPLKDRQLSLISSHSEICYNFIHLPNQNVKYQVEYGVGMKIKGQEIFKKVSNSNGFGLIEGLNPNTKYRVRMRVAEGIWGPITEIVTLDLPKFNLQTASCAKSMSQNSVQIGKGGIIYGSNQIHFGIHRWVIKLTSKSISYEDSETACMSVGVSNKQLKKAIFVGTTLNYGYQKNEIVLKILIDCNEKRLTILNCTTNQEEVYQNLPNFPLFPTIQNRGNGQIHARYNLTSDDTNLC